MGGVLALDLATTTGWAYGNPEDGLSPTILESTSRVAPPPYSYGSKIIGRSAWPDGRIFDAAETYLNDLITIHNPSVLVYEAPFVGKSEKLAVPFRLLNLAGLAEKLGYQREIARVFSANVSTVRKHFIGHGRLPGGEAKDAVIARCKAIGWDPKTEDAADALAVLDYAIHCLNPRRKAA